MKWSEDGLSGPGGLSRIALVLAAAMHLQPAAATELVHSFVNPTFGGNPANGTMLMNVATAQNSNKAPSLTPLEQFNKQLQQAILNKLASQTMSYMFGGSNTLSPGSYETAGYAVDIVSDGSGGLVITTTDRSSGATASFNVSGNSLEQ
jgi:curli production assembly/transport component CsgF